MTTSRLKTGRPNANCALWNASSVEFHTRLETIHTKRGLYAAQRFRPRPRRPRTTIIWRIYLSPSHVLASPTLRSTSASSLVVLCSRTAAYGSCEPRLQNWWTRSSIKGDSETAVTRAQLGSAPTPHAMARSLVARRLFAMLVPSRLPSQSPRCSRAPLEMEATWLLASVGRRWLEV